MKNTKQKDLTEYPLAEAVKKVKDYSKEKFDATVEVHIALNTDAKKQEHQLRFPLTLPHGTGKTKKVAVFASKKVASADLELSEEDINKIEKGELKPKADFEVIVSEPRYMPKLAKVAKILGPAGMMPNPKTGTVTEDVENAVKQIKLGKIEIKTEKGAPVIHNIIGKTSFDENHLAENLTEVVKNLRQNKPAKFKGEMIKNIIITSSMGKPFRVDPASL
jgi:large subunit ribosomal protein L1